MTIDYQDRTLPFEDRLEAFSAYLHSNMFSMEEVVFSWLRARDEVMRLTVERDALATAVKPFAATCDESSLIEEDLDTPVYPGITRRMIGAVVRALHAQESEEKS